MYINFKIQVSVFICIILAISRMILDRMLEDTVLESALMSASLIGEYILPPSLHSSYDTKDIEWSKLFRAEYKNILNELYEFEEKVNCNSNTYLPFDIIYPGQEYLESNHQWSALTLYCYGTTTAVSSHFPFTMRLVDRINSNSFFPTIYHVFYSILAPNQSLLAHTGPNRGVLRYQLHLHI
eukprot:985327_1